jgi:hypothetical protein
MTDSHGSLDVFCEVDWRNLSFSKSDKKKIELNGANLNSLLKGLFLLFGSPNENKNLPGGIEVWEEIVEPTFVCLNQICSVDDFLSRIFEIINKLIESNIAPSSSSSVSQQQKKKKISTVLTGGIWFLWYWINSFSDFLSDREKILLSVGLKTLRNAINSSSIMLEHIDKTIQKNIDKIIEKLRRNPLGKVSRFAVEPNFSFVEGTWDETSIATPLTAKEKTEVLKKELSKGPKLKLEIFGGDLLLDDDSDEDDDEEEEEEVKKEENEESKIITFPISRIKKGQSLLKPIDDILSLDIIELARQWTLVDHELFQSISLSDILVNSFSSSSAIASSFYENDKIFENIKGTGFRKLVDRFNASSLYITQAVLTGNSIEERAKTLSFFISLANEFHKLGNFHGLMVILTALQQGCISRMTATFDLVSKEDLTIMNNLKVKTFWWTWFCLFTFLSLLLSLFFLFCCYCCLVYSVETNVWS